MTLHEDHAVSIGSTDGAGPMVPVIHRVVAATADLDDTTTLTVRPVDNALPRPQPGQFNMLWLPGIGEVPISLAGLDGDDLVHTIRNVGAVTDALCSLQVGDFLGVRGPFGAGWNLARARGRDVLVVAGGLGIVPLGPLVDELISDRANFGQVSVVIGNRSPDTLLYPERVKSWAESLEVEVTVDVASPDWTGHVGVVTELLTAVNTDPANQIAFVCGPEVMMRFAAEAVIDRGTPAENVLVSLERNMHCAIGHCGRCQLGPMFICKDGPVLPWSRVDPVLKARSR